MPDQIPDLLWLPLGGLVAVVLLALALIMSRHQLRQKQAVEPRAPRTPPVLGGVKPVTAAVSPASKSEDVVEMLRAELAEFRAAYRADLAQVLAELRDQTATSRPAMPQDAQGRLEQAIELARVGQDAASISSRCDLDLADAAALVRFHGPGRGIAASTQH